MISVLGELLQLGGLWSYLDLFLGSLALVAAGIAIRRPDDRKRFHVAILATLCTWLAGGLGVAVALVEGGTAIAEASARLAAEPALAVKLVGMLLATSASSALTSAFFVLVACAMMTVRVLRRADA